MYGRPLRRQKQRKQRKLRLELTRIQRQLRRRVHREQQLLWQLQQQQAQLQQQQRDQRKLEQEYAHWRHLFWQQQLQQQSLLQQQVHHHLTQRPEQHDWLQQKEQAQLLYAQEDGERQESMQEGEQQVTPQEERERRREKAKGKQEEHGDPELWEDEERQLLQPTGPLSGPFLEDEWIASDSSKHVATQPNTSQQALQASADAITARPLISEGSFKQVIPGHAAALVHPFVRLPKRQVKKVPEAFRINLRRAVATGVGIRNPVPLLQRAHDLLLQEVLLPGHVGDLARVAEDLIVHAVNYQQQDLSQLQASRVVERMGMRFLVLDAVVSAFIVIGQEPEEEPWKLLTNAISHAVPRPAQVRPATGRPNVSSNRVQELTRAMQILKTGKRPNPEDLLSIKRMLFCSPSCPLGFRKDEFDRWREDDKCTAGWL
ncbi:hypothetical protein EBH_0047780 [Eimeria brunetti]|uniref:Uncharacterized protein n=1 Tax=Eimeria brunetti TaxID=51314 RepID=U6LUC6_9EIME|nr:hypothetical protein EBH_0047780 [Eimeria brunetti]